MANHLPLTREEMCRVIEGRGCAPRVPVLFHFWLDPNVFGQQAQAVRDITAPYPDDAVKMELNIPSVYDAPEDESSYRWSYMDAPSELTALDNNGFIEDWDEQLQKLLDDFPDPDSAHLLPECPPEDGRYRLCVWWHLLFERLWTLRGMENSLTDFLLYPEAVHAVFRKLTDFYKRMITRAHAHLHPDGIFTSDDLGTQTGPFFSPEIFDAFFAPYYREIIDHTHSLGMHFWLHVCGNVEVLLPRFTALGVDVLHPIQKYTMDESRIAREYGHALTIWAGFDVQRTIPYGTPGEVHAEVRRLTDTYARPDGRFMLTFGNAITADTPIESLRAVFEEAFSAGKKAVAPWQSPSALASAKGACP